MTGGAFHSAEDAEQLARGVRPTSRRTSSSREEQPRSAWFAALGALLAAAAVVASIRWSPYP